MKPLPLPPIELRRQVGPIEDRFFDNPMGKLIEPAIPPEAYESVLDWGCGCGRLARQLIQQEAQPRRYVGIDLNRDAIAWCVKNLAPHAPHFKFSHQDVYNKGFNPTGTKTLLPFPVPDQSVSLALAWSVFTHVLEPDAPFYLRELARVLRPDGYALTTWFVFDKREFPMMESFQNALYINLNDPTHAIIYDKRWLRDQAKLAGLVMAKIWPAGIRGYQRKIIFRPAATNVPDAEFPPDPPLRDESGVDESQSTPSAAGGGSEPTALSSQ